MKTDDNAIDEILTGAKAQVLREGMGEVGQNADESEAADLLEALHGAIRNGADPDQLDAAAWGHVLQMLGNLSQARAAQGSSAGETTHFILALKRPLFKALHANFAGDSQSLMNAVWALSTMMDKLAQWTVTAYQRSREDVIAR